MPILTAFVRFITPLLVVTALLGISACSTSHFPGVYRIDIEQGNIVDSAQLEQVKIGMNKRQVRYLLGSPMIQDTFNQNRWDYYYSFETGKGNLDRERVTLTFDGELLSNIESINYKPAQKKY